MTIDGHDLRDVTMRSLRSQLGVVPQEPFLFAGTIGDNIAFARPDASDDEIHEAVARGRAHRRHRPDARGPRHRGPRTGPDPVLGRAPAHRPGPGLPGPPRVLVLDEATSNLDLQSETKIEAALDVLLENRTAILIAHRLSTAMRADRIAVVDEGRIIEVGSHDELVAPRRPLRRDVRDVGEPGRRRRPRPGASSPPPEGPPGRPMNGPARTATLRAARRHGHPGGSSRRRSTVAPHACPADPYRRRRGDRRGRGGVPRAAGGGGSHPENPPAVIHTPQRARHVIGPDAPPVRLLRVPGG